MSRIEIVQGDITVMVVDAIVNAANTSLLGGGGVDGAIHRAAGPQLLDECRKLGGCPTGEARVSRGYHLPATLVIHTVGPIWRGGHEDEERTLARCYDAVLQVAVENGVRTLAFPSISTGAYRFPLARAVPIAVQRIRRFVATSPLPQKVFVVCYEPQVYQAYLEECNRQESPNASS